MPTKTFLSRTSASRTCAAVLALGFWLGTSLPAFAQTSPSALLNYAQRPTTDTDGYLVAGDYWNTLKPMNTSEPNGVEDPNRDIGALHWITLGPDGTNWENPNGIWPGGYDLTSNWRDGLRLVFPAFKPGGWDGQLKADEADDDRYAFAYYTPDVPGASDPERAYTAPATYVDEARTHLVYEAGWPTNLGIDFKIRAHQYTVNEQNLNDFNVIEITMTNTGVLDANADGEPEATDHVIDAVSAAATWLPTLSVRIRNNSNRLNSFGAGRTMGYLVPDNDDPPLYVWYANVPPNRTEGRTAPAPGERLIGVNDGRTLEGYTDVWNSVQWLGAKQGSFEGSGSAADKTTIFGTPPVGSGAERGWYTSISNQDGSLFNQNRADLSFFSATATWYEDYGKTSNFDSRNLAPNGSIFSGGTAEDVTTFGPAAPGVRPNGDYKYGSVDVGPEAIGQPVWEDVLNPGASSGDFYGATGFTQEYTFGQNLSYGMGPFSLEVGESMTLVFVMSGGFRWEGVADAHVAAEWAWQRDWDISAELPVPPVPDVNVESTTDGTAILSWTDVSGIDGDIDGYKIWRSAQFARESWFPSQEDGANGFALVDNYHHLHEPDGSIDEFADPGNPYFDAFDEFAGETQNFYQPAEWGPYDLIEKIPVGDLAQFPAAEGSAYAYAFEDTDAITGFTYWYYVSSYKEGQFSGPRGAVPVGHIESSNVNRNGRNSRDVANGTIGLTAPWIDTYPYAINASDYPADQQNLKNIGGPFTVTPPVATVAQVPDLITVTPNPYKRTGLNDVRNDPSSHNINFLNLPADFRLTIMDVSGQIVFQTDVQGATDGKFTWDQFSKDGVEVASGLYIYHVEYGNRREVVGHFAILR
jgi:hypothetical protein